MNESTCPPEPTPIDLVRTLREALGLFSGAMPCCPASAWEEAIEQVRDNRAAAESYYREQRERAEYKRLKGKYE